MSGALPHLWLRLRRRWAACMAHMHLRRIQRQACECGDIISSIHADLAVLRRDRAAGHDDGGLQQSIDWLMDQAEIERERLRELSLQAVQARSTVLRLELQCASSTPAGSPGTARVRRTVRTPTTVDADDLRAGLTD